MVAEIIEPIVPHVRKSEGFNGQRAIVLPDKVIKSYRKSALISNIFITDIGFIRKQNSITESEKRERPDKF